MGDCVPELSDGGGCRRTPCSWPPGALSPGPAAAGSSSPAPGTPTPMPPFITFIQFRRSGTGIRCIYGPLDPGSG